MMWYDRGKEVDPMDNHEEFNKEAKTLNRLVIGEWITLATIFLGCFGFLYSEMKSVSTTMHDRMLAQEKRIDDLYKMFIDLVKETKS